MEKNCYCAYLQRKSSNDSVLALMVLTVAHAAVLRLRALTLDLGQRRRATHKKPKLISEQIPILVLDLM